MTRAISILIAAVAIGATAQLAIPLPENFAAAPITGQTLAVSVAAYLLGSKDGPLAVLLYLLLGALGLPLFSDFKSGLTVLTGPTMGYFVGFVLAAFLIGKWKENKAHKFGQYFLAFLLGTLTILMLGMLGLLRYLSLKEAFLKGVLPFLAGGLVKILLAAILISLISRFKKLMNQEGMRPN
ncbi:MAG: biotin transporter BioY [Vicingaceae bacterium]